MVSQNVNPTSLPKVYLMFSDDTTPVIYSEWAHRTVRKRDRVHGNYHEIIPDLKARITAAKREILMQWGHKDLFSHDPYTCIIR